MTSRHEGGRDRKGTGTYRAKQEAKGARASLADAEKNQMRGKKAGTKGRGKGGGRKGVEAAIEGAPVQDECQGNAMQPGSPRRGGQGRASNGQ